MVFKDLQVSNNFSVSSPSDHVLLVELNRCVSVIYHEKCMSLTMKDMVLLNPAESLLMPSTQRQYTQGRAGYICNDVCII